MQDTEGIVIIEILAVQDHAKLKAYISEATDAIVPYGGQVIAHGNGAIEGETGFGPLAIQRWRSQEALDEWLDTETYRHLDQLRRASATMRVAVLPVITPRAG